MAGDEAQILKEARHTPATSVSAEESETASVEVSRGLKIPP
jgi:hypothetical protein